MTEARAFGELAADAAGELTDMVRDTHRAIAGRVFAAVGPGARAIGVKALHDGISTAVYSAVRASARTAAMAGGAAAGDRRLTGSPRGVALVGAINGAWGDLLAAQDSPLAVDMAFHGAPARRTRRLAVFAHGLCETELSWRLGSERDEPYPDRFARELGYTPLVLRYNTGLRIADNGTRLAELLERTVDAWPHPVDEIVLVGHSMGGLVARCAAHEATERGLKWPGKVRHVFSLAAPFGGADLERAANVAAWALRALPETRSLARALDRRSAGIKDLGHGHAREDMPWLPHARHTFIAASPFRDADHPVGPANHFALANHPRVYEQLRRELGPAPERRPRLLTA